MDFRYRITRRLSLTVIMILALFACSSSILANTTNTIPFAQSFEGFTNGETVVGTDGWYHSDEAVATVFTTNYSGSYLGGATYPIQSATHTNVLKLTDIPLDSRLTNMVTGCENSKIWLDFVINPVHWLETNAPSVSNDAQLAFYVTTNNGHLVLWHATNNQAQSAKAWNEITDTSISSTEWHRVIINIDYATTDAEAGGRFCTVKLNGTKITNQYAYADNADATPGTEGGSWFCLGIGNALTNMNSLALSGNGYLDDFVITNQNPISRNVVVTSAYAQAAGVPAIPSTTSYPEDDPAYCSVTNSPVTVGGTQQVCTGWTGTGSAPSSGATTNTTFTVTENSTVTWIWGTEYYLNTETNPVGGGYVNVADSWKTAGSSVPITATFNPNYHFDYWSGNTGGCFIVANVITAVMTQARTITANFAINTNRLIVLSGYDGAKGIPAIPSTNFYNYGDPVNCAVTNSPVADGGTQYVCTAWQGTGSAPASGATTNTSFTITNDSQVTWIWGTTNYYLTTASNGIGGSVSPASDWQAKGSSVPITATFNPNYQFDNWSGNTGGCYIVDNVITAVMTQARAITANFSLAAGAYGTPSSWFTAYGLTSYVSWTVGETNDFDNDGKLNWEEYVTGTDPTNALSLFRILAQGYLGSSNYVVWYGTTNSGVTTPFSIDRCTNLTAGWGVTYITDVGTRDPYGTGTNIWWDTNAPASAPVFYRPLVIWTN